MEKNINKNDSSAVSATQKLVECAVLVALGTVISIIPLLSLPYGGSVTVASLLPVIIISYRHGLKYGLTAGFAYAVLQQLLGLKNLSYFSSALSVAAVILLDYLIAFTLIGLGGIFRKSIENQSGALVAGSFFVCLLRYLCHVVSGATVWAGLSIPTKAALVYSLIYNATYMIPETIVTVVAAYFLGSAIDFRGKGIRGVLKAKEKEFPVLELCSAVVAAGTIIAAVAILFKNMQDPETGSWNTEWLGSVNWLSFGIVLGAGIIIAGTLFTVAKIRRLKKDSEKTVE